MGGVVLFFLALGAGALGLWLLVMALQALFALLLALLGFTAAIFTGKWLWDFINEDDEPEDPAPPK